jgi:hypothetical protein
MSEPGYDPGLTEQERGVLQWRKQVELASLPADRYPRLVEAAVPMTSCDDGPDFHYRFGVDLFIGGVRRSGPRTRPREPESGRSSGGNLVLLRLVLLIDVHLALNGV